MYLAPKKSFRWTSGVCCCGSLTSVLMTLLVQTINHLAMLTASSIMLNTTESFLDTIISAVDTNDRLLQRSEFYNNIKDNILQNPTLYSAIPIVINVVFLLCNIFAIFGVILRHRLLMVPWLMLSFIKIIFTLSLLVYTVVLLPIEWFRAILSLVVLPIIVLDASFWMVILRFYIRLKSSSKKTSALQNSAGASVKPKPKLKSQMSKASDDISTTVGMSELAISPPHMAWDPEFLLELDPRYIDADEATEDDDGHDDDDCRDSEVEWDTENEDEETYYQSDEYTERGEREDTEFFTESEGEYLDKIVDDDIPTIKEEETDFDDAESEHYKTPGIPRPVLRSQSPSPVYTMEGTTTMSSTA